MWVMPALPLLPHLFFFFYLLLGCCWPSSCCCTQLDLFANYNLNCHITISLQQCFMALGIGGAAAYAMKTLKVGSFHLGHNSLHTFGRPLNNYLILDDVVFNLAEKVHWAPLIKLASGCGSVDLNDNNNNLMGYILWMVFLTTVVLSGLILYKHL